MVMTSGGGKERGDGRVARAIEIQCSRSCPFVESASLTEPLTSPVPPGRTILPVDSGVSLVDRR